MSNALGPLPQTISVSYGPTANVRLPWQIVPFPLGLHVRNAGGVG